MRPEPSLCPASIPISVPVSPSRARARARARARTVARARANAWRASEWTRGNISGTGTGLIVTQKPETAKLAKPAKETRREL